MARVQVYQATNFYDAVFWYGEVERADTSRIVLSDGSFTTTYRGSFSYDAWDEPYGVLTGFEETYLGARLSTVTGISVEANQAYQLIVSGDDIGLLQVALRGADTIIGSEFSDTLDGFAGNDRIFGGGGNDDIWGDAGSDYIDGGTGADTAHFLESRSDYIVTSFGGKIGVSGLGAETGTDILVGVERLAFWDAEIAAPKQNFDALEYIASYGDLIVAFGDNAELGFSHYVNRGAYEGRVTTFDSLEYVASYRDLINAFGADADDGARHYINHGAREGREVSFDSLEYIASHRDLINAFGTNADSGAQHYINYGAREGRTTTFDSLEYIASYRDLIDAFGANADRGAQHFIANGAREGRSADLFDAEQYLGNYADLRGVFGDDTEAATRHYIQYGANEGRTDDALNPFPPDDFLF